MGAPARDFSFAQRQDGSVAISWRGRVVAILSGDRGARFVAQANVADEAGEQLLMAKATGNFKHGNER